ncbi:unnamed protein product, partial [Callosobruchus maculatus]
MDRYLVNSSIEESRGTQRGLQLFQECNGMSESTEPVSSSSTSSSSSISTRKMKSKRRVHRFNNLWLEDENFWLVKSEKSTKTCGYEYAYCKVCDVTIFPNKTDIVRHKKSDKHSSLTHTIQKKN